MSLENFVNLVRNLYQQQQQAIPYQEIYNVVNQNLEILFKNQQNLENLLQIFTLPDYTLPHVAILYTFVQHQQKQQAAAMDATQLLNLIETCLKQAHEIQVQLASDIFAELSHYYTNKLCETNQAKRGLLVVFNAIKLLQKTPNQLTSMHSDLMQLCLTSKNFKLALNLLQNNDVLDINKENGAYDSKAILTYFYYASCIYAALKDYDNALFYFEQALTIPCCSISQIMIEAYKKFLLISLILRSKLTLLPKYTSRIVLTQIKPICMAYHELAQAFTNSDLDKFNSTIQKYIDLYQQDRNFGLIKQLKQAFFKKNIQRLTKTFITLSLDDMAVKVKLTNSKDAEAYVLNMIKDGEIYATINQKANMVSFHDNPQKYDTPAMMDYLSKQMFNSIDMDKKIKEMDREITIHPHYIQKCMSTSAIDDSDPINK